MSGRKVFHENVKFLKVFKYSNFTVLQNRQLICQKSYCRSQDFPITSSQTKILRGSIFGLVFVVCLYAMVRDIKVHRFFL